MALPAAASDDKMDAQGDALLRPLFEAPYALHIDVTDAPLPGNGALPKHHAPPAHAAADDDGDGLLANERESLCSSAQCCTALFFPFLSGAATAQAIGYSGFLVGLYFLLTYYGAICMFIGTRTKGDGDVNAYNEVMSACLLLYFLGIALLRRAMRKFYALAGWSGNDLVFSFWCLCCVLARMSAQTEKAEATARNTAAAAATLPGYRAA